MFVHELDFTITDLKTVRFVQLLPTFICNYTLSIWHMSPMPHWLIVLSTKFNHIKLFFMFFFFNNLVVTATIIFTSFLFFYFRLFPKNIKINSVEIFIGSCWNIYIHNDRLSILFMVWFCFTVAYSISRNSIPQQARANRKTIHLHRYFN